MGNKLCAPLWKKTYRDEDHPWAPKKDSHLLRLWAEIFHVVQEEDDLRWDQISDDVVPVNITCIQDNPETVFQITAYNRHVEKIFDVRLIQPGTRITLASECFAHWQDSRYDHEWGLNFTTPLDARRFRDCCMSPSHKLSRKATSSTSIRLSPPKKVKTRRAQSQPTSPVTKPRRAISTPEELTALNRESQRYTTDSCDSTDENRRSVPNVAATGSNTAPRSVNKPARNIPDSRAVFQQNDLSKPPSQSNLSVYDNVRSANKKASKYDNVDLSKQVPRRTDSEDQQSEGDDNLATYVPEAETPYQTSKPLQLCETAFINNNINNNVTEVKALSREPTVIFKVTDTNDNCPHDNTQTKGRRDLTVERPIINQSDCTSPLSPPRKSQSSSSPEWPPPPDPISPVSPVTPICSSSFDSDALKKMLRNLPTAETDTDTDGPEDTSYIPSCHSSPIRSSYNDGSPVHSETKRSHPDLVSTGLAVHNFSYSTNHQMARREAESKMEYEMQLRGGVHTGRDSYPDSGLSNSNMSASIRSSESSRSQKAATLPPGLGLGLMPTKSDTSTSSGGSSTGRPPSEHGRHRCSAGSHGTDIKDFHDSDLSESESDQESSNGSDSGSSIRTMPRDSQASLASKSGAVRKAGWLVVKNWLIHKKRKIELAPKRNWKKYWVCLKGTMLLFFSCDDNSVVPDGSVPRHMLVIEGSISQSVPEHPKREHIFALSTAFGDAYLFEAMSHTELENWVNAIHSACASSFARQHGKDNTLKLLRSEIHKLENSIDIDIKMKKMADLQLSVVTDPKSKQAIVKQIAQWEENLEKLYIEQYRLRCYMASLQGSDLPNPKTLLTYVSKGTKITLGRIGVFTVTSFHALVCARTPLTTAKLYKRNKKRGVLSTFRSDSVTKIKSRPYSPQQPGSTFKTTDLEEQFDYDKEGGDNSGASETLNFAENLTKIMLPGNQSIVIDIHEKMTVQDVLEAVCNRRQLNPTDHFIRFLLPGGGSHDNSRIPDKSAFMENQEYEGIDICQKILFQTELIRCQRDTDFGFLVEAELAEDSEQEDELCVFVSEVVKGGLAHRKGIQVGDEILVMNSKVVSDLDMVYVETVLLEAQALCLTIRSCRVERPYNSVLMQHSDVYIDNLMCPPPPSQNRITDKALGQLIVPAPTWVQDENQKNEEEDDYPYRVLREHMTNMSAEQIHTLLQSADQVTEYCRLLHGSHDLNVVADEQGLIRPLTDSQKLRKVIRELIDTERQYVKDLNCLIERYLEPLKEETFLSGEDIEHLFGNIQEIVIFQRLFLQSLEEAVTIEHNCSVLDENKQYRDEALRRVLFSLGGAFLYYANHFKLYSSFCASHSKSQEVLNPDNNPQLAEFLRARNPKQQHSATLESYLIKPIQRILKYPLLLKQLQSLTSPNTDEHYHLSEALRGMQAVANHINEMQKIYEEYGTIFDELVKVHKEAHPHSKPLDLNVGDLQMYGNVNWLNALEEIGKVKKGTELVTTCFVFKAGVVMLCKEKVKAKKKQKNPAPKSPVTDITLILRYEAVIPVNEVQIRGNTAGDSATHGLWELIHLKSETEGRPEKIFQMASSLSAKNDFLKTIRNTIRESVRKMTIPTSKHQGKGKQITPLQMTGSGGASSIKCHCDNPCNINPAGAGLKKHSKQSQPELVRHSMELDEKFNIPQYDSEFRTRSQTFSDLNNIVTSLDDDDDDDSDTYLANSQSTINSSESRYGSAKLLHSSQNPTTYSTSSGSSATSVMSGKKDNTDTGGDGGKAGGGTSPVWKPRHATKPVKHVQLQSPQTQARQMNQTVFSQQGYTDYATIRFDEQTSSILTNPNMAYIEYEDTEC